MPGSLGVAQASLEDEARECLAAGLGPGLTVVTAAAPGRCTLVGEHVDYAGGLVLAAAIDRHVAVAVRPAADHCDRVVVDGCCFEHPPGAEVRPEGGGYVLAAAEALRRSGLDVPPFAGATAATLPAAAGLASSAAVICATLVALLRLRATTLSATALVNAAYAAEHDVLGVPSGRLDQHTIVETPGGGAVLLDFATDAVTPVSWGITGAVLCVCDTGERHSVAGAEYRTRRAETEAALQAAGAATAQGIAAPPDGGELAARRLRHVVTESRRAALAAVALSAGDRELLGRLMSDSHRSLRDDAEVSTATLDAVVAAAHAVPGCFGARLVGAGFGGSVLALTTSDAAAACNEAMLEVAGPGASAWVVAPSPGLAITAGATVARG